MRARTHRYSRTRWSGLALQLKAKVTSPSKPSMTISSHLRHDRLTAVRTRDQLLRRRTQQTKHHCTLTLALRRLQLIGRSFGDPPEGLASCQCRGAARATTPVAPNTACGSDDTTVGGPTCGRATARSAPALGVVVQLGPLAVHEREPIVPCLRAQACRTCGWLAHCSGRE